MPPLSLASFVRMSSPAASSSSVSDAAKADRAREHRASLTNPSTDRCAELSQKSLRCQMDAQIKLNQITQTSEVLRACKSVDQRGGDQTRSRRSPCPLLTHRLVLSRSCVPARPQIDEYILCHRRESGKRKM